MIRAILLVILVGLLGGQVKAEIMIPYDVRKAITKDAKKRHPHKPDVQEHVIEQQIIAYKKMLISQCPKRMLENTFREIKKLVRKKHPHNFVTQWWLLNEQVKAWWEIKQLKLKYPIPRKLFFDAEKKYPYDYVTQANVVKEKYKAVLWKRNFK